MTFQTIFAVTEHPRTGPSVRSFLRSWRFFDQVAEALAAAVQPAPPPSEERSELHKEVVRLAGSLVGFCLLSI